ncbi:SusC/RagA family TonB-linked outer membrane protein [Pontibacter sp. SGAir0037]|uniref:SusC/RagA family TonB-linked outer membrane protein n=1 Tax=Pontibacter sp. SGAir0037 TaxID=2571030 RepID=UPI0010CCFDA6|nr:SusC/RagA family TonB-linked outer membrane protein [Pontibacter sp. SGAir0037]QCR22258.1 SusC/RagA family TonB-linked outer membrane protein [Pontibacter sp. SGAir0037]
MSQNLQAQKKSSTNRRCSALLLALLGFGPISGHAQAMQTKAVNLSIAEGSIQQVFKEIEAKTDYNFAYTQDVASLNRTFSLNGHNRSIDEVLQTLAKEGDLAFHRENNTISVSIASSSNVKKQDAATVSGFVKDDAGQPLPGVSVHLKGSTTGTITNADGKFTLNLSGTTQPVLVFAYLGFKTREFVPGNEQNFTVVLQEDTKSLQEVVVTALGIKKDKKSVGYAVQEVQGEDLVKAREGNMVSSLTGKVAGLTIRNSTDLFQDPSISLRGRKPLLVIDGVPDQTADLWKVNSDDVESITVLKGSTASALYGSIGRNGAIMITTKRGKGKDLSVEFNSSTMFQPGFIRIPEVQTTYGNGNNGRYAYVNGSGGGVEGSGWIWGPKLNQPDPNTPSGYWETPQYNSPVDPVTGQRQPLPWIARGKDNVKNFFETGLISTNSISITKASENGSIRAAASHIYQGGIVPNTDLNNTSFSLAANYALSPKLTSDVRISYNRQYTDNFPETGYGPTNYLYNLILWTGPDVDIRDLRNYWAAGREGEQQRHYNQSWYNNPYFQAYEYERGYYKDNTFGSVTLDYKLSPSFSAKYRTGVNVYGLTRSTKEPKSYVGYSDISRGNYYLSNENYFDIISDIILRYERKVSDNFTISAQAGAANNYQNLKSQNISTDGLTIPGFYNLGNSANPVLGTNTIEEQQKNSIYGVVDMEMFGAFYLSLTGRNDWISTLPLVNNSFFYPSVTGSLVLSDLITMPNTISYMKVRSSWSRVSEGSFRSYPYSHIAAYENGVKWNGTPSLYYGSTYINPNLHPETSDAWEAGLEVNLLKNRLGFDVTYYQAKDYNIINEIPVSSTSGYSYRLENGNVYQRKGIELVARATPIAANKFTWNVAANFSQYRRQLKEIFGGSEELNRLKPGDRTDKIFATVYETDPQGNIIYNSNGYPKNDPFSRFVGYDEPDWVYGVENSFKYGNFGLRFQVDGRIGGLLYSTTNQKMWWGGTHPGTVNQFRDQANAGEATFVGEGVVVVGGDVKYDSKGNIVEDTRVFAPNTKNVSYINYMINTSNAHNHNYHYYDETFLKLREVTLTYDLPAQLLQRIPVRAASLSFVGRNLLLWSKLPNVDPDSGVDNLQTPSTRSMGFNLNLKF